MNRYTLCTHSSQVLSINTPQSFTIFHSMISHSLILLSFYNVFSTLAFHTRTIKSDGAAPQICNITQGLKAVCLGARLTIRVSFSLERKQTLPQPPSPSIFLCCKISFRFCVSCAANYH
jgi:hypothetical protein